MKTSAAPSDAAALLLSCPKHHSPLYHHIFLDRLSSQQIVALLLFSNKFLPPLPPPISSSSSWQRQEYFPLQSLYSPLLKSLKFVPAILHLWGCPEICSEAGENKSSSLYHILPPLYSLGLAFFYLPKGICKHFLYPFQGFFIFYFSWLFNNFVFRPFACSCRTVITACVILVFREESNPFFPQILNRILQN